MLPGIVGARPAGDIPNHCRECHATPTEWTISYDDGFAPEHVVYDLMIIKNTNWVGTRYTHGIGAQGIRE